MIPQVSQIQEIMAIPQEYFWLPWAVQYFFSLVLLAVQHFMHVGSVGKVVQVINV